VWEDSSEKREASLKERKAQMILAARQCVSFILWETMPLIAVIPGECWRNSKRNQVHDDLRHAMLHVSFILVVIHISDLTPIPQPWVVG
jgi:uncharacterized protein YqhQ